MNDFSSETHDFPAEIDKITKYFLINLGLIVIIGIVMVYSSSYIYAKEVFGSSVHFFIKQLVFMALGTGVAFVVGRTKLYFWIKYGFYINLFCFVLLLCTFVPVFGQSAKGSSRWIVLFGQSFQPGELVKFSLMILAIHFFDNFKELDLQNKVKYALSLALPFIPLILQPDYGTFLICFIVISFVCFISSFDRKHFYSIFFSGAFVGLVILFMQSYRVERIFAYLDPWKNSKTSGFQIIQSYLAFANGGIQGLGLGNSNEKLFYLPEAHNDFIFSVIGEEVGFIGVTITILLFVTLIYLGLKLAYHVKDRVGFMMISSVVFTLALLSLLNMGVVLGLLPTKGLNLPFVSYGGSSALSNFFGIGLVLSALRDHKKSDNF